MNNRENEEQRAVSQTLCGALQKEPNCKCLVLSILIYGCLAAVTWCRCANVTKVVINFSRYPIKSTKHVSPCDDGYIYIPVAFMGMLYLVYLVECYHSPIRLDLLHAESQDSVLSRLAQLRSAQPTIWWKAVSYHYVRRKRQITRYRNGDNYTTTQVYYERINTHVATSVYYYDYCGAKDISKDLVLDPKIPITKIALTKGFAFSNVRSATEFEEARSRFFAEQELRDDYMEMREGLDLGYNPNPTTLIAVLGSPWFANRYVYWCLSALLLSWPLRLIIECKTQYADYQVTKLFGVHYDTPTGSEPIHTSMSELSHPGSYMLAPSYSEALLMAPAPSDQRAPVNEEDLPEEIVPSYSEALLYERAEFLEDRPYQASETEGTSEQPTIQNRSSGPILIPRDLSEPNLRSCGLRYVRVNGKSLQNILESEQETQEEPSLEEDLRNYSSKGAIPKRAIASRIIENPMAGEQATPRISGSRTHFCIKSILKQSKRASKGNGSQEISSLLDLENQDVEANPGRFSYHEGCAAYAQRVPKRHKGFTSGRSLDSRSRESLEDLLPQAARKESDRENVADKRDTRTLIFASPIKEVYPSDPFAGKTVIETKQRDTSPLQDFFVSYDRQLSQAEIQDPWRQRYSVSYSAEHHYPLPTAALSASSDAVNAHTTVREDARKLISRAGVSFPPYSSSQRIGSRQSLCGLVSARRGLTRSATERRAKPPGKNASLRRSFTGRIDDYRGDGNRNLSVETAL